jgi:hypothetical protein
MCYYVQKVLKSLKPIGATVHQLLEICSLDIRVTIYGFRMILRINSNYLSKRRVPILILIMETIVFSLR